MTLPAIYWSLSELTSLLHKYDALNQIIKCLNQIISENKPYNLHLYTFTFHKFQEKNLNLNRNSNSDLQILMINKWQVVSWIIKPCKSGISRGEFEGELE